MGQRIKFTVLSSSVKYKYNETARIETFFPVVRMLFLTQVLKVTLKIQGTESFPLKGRIRSICFPFKTKFPIIEFNCSTALTGQPL